MSSSIPMTQNPSAASKSGHAAVSVNDEESFDSKEEGEDEDDLDELDLKEPPPHLFGHRFHWSEIFFVLMLGVGLAFLFAGGSIPAPAFLVYGIYAATAAIGTMLIWNLISIKRVAAATEQLLKDVKMFKQENKRARKLQDDFKKQDAQMKAQLAELEKAELLLKGSANGLEDIRKQEEEMMKEREALLAERREVAAKLMKNMDNLWRLTIDKAKEELHKRALMFFDDIAVKDPDGTEVIHVDSDEFESLVGMLGSYGLEVGHGNPSDPYSLANMAGDDKRLDYNEYCDWLDHKLENHFSELSDALHKVEMLKEEIREAERFGEKKQNQARRRQTVAAMGVLRPGS